MSGRSRLRKLKDTADRRARGVGGRPRHGSFALPMRWASCDTGRFFSVNLKIQTNCVYELRGIQVLQTYTCSYACCNYNDFSYHFTSACEELQKHGSLLAF